MYVPLSCRRAMISDGVARSEKGTGQERCHLEIHPQGFHRASGDNHQAVRKGDVVIVDDIPCATWKMAMIHELLVTKEMDWCSYCQ